MTQRVYLDHAATTPTAPEVVAVMEPFFTKQFGNPSGLYEEGRAIKDVLRRAREVVAENIHATRPGEIIFTSGGTESDALAILGVMRKHGGHLIVGATEHHAVLYNAEMLEREEFAVDYAPVDKEGVCNIAALERLVRPDTTLISIMLANNEIGTIAPTKEIKQLIERVREKRKTEGNTHPIFWHSDACQAMGYMSVNVVALGVDLLSFNGSKIYGPKGVGALYIRRGIQIDPLWRGGGQEKKLRSGTENVPGIVGFARALELVEEKRDVETKRLSELRDYFLTEITGRIPKVVINGPSKETSTGIIGGENRLPNNVNISILDIEGEALLLYLDHHGIAASTGSACDSITLDPSHVILALGLPYEFAHASMRFTLGRGTTKADIDYVLDVLPDIVKTLRAVSPITLNPDAKEMSSKTAFVGEGLPHWERKKAKK